MEVPVTLNATAGAAISPETRRILGYLMEAADSDAAYSDATKKAHRNRAEAIRGWAQSRGLELPLSPFGVAVFIVDSDTCGYAFSTIQHFMSTMRWMHRKLGVDPTNHETIKELMRGVRRKFLRVLQIQESLRILYPCPSVRRMFLWPLPHAHRPTLRRKGRADMSASELLEQIACGTSGMEEGHVLVQVRGMTYTFHANGHVVPFTMPWERQPLSARETFEFYRMIEADPDWPEILNLYLGPDCRTARDT